MYSSLVYSEILHIALKHTIIFYNLKEWSRIFLVNSPEANVGYITNKCDVTAYKFTGFIKIACFLPEHSIHHTMSFQCHRDLNFSLRLVPQASSKLVDSHAKVSQTLCKKVVVENYLKRNK